MKSKAVEHPAFQYAILFDLAFKQFMHFAEFINDSDEKIETWKYADYLLHDLNSKFAKLKKEKRWKYPYEMD